MIRGVLILLLSLFPLLASAEYRVFTLKISKPNPDPKLPPTEKIFDSNFDPDQYRSVFPLEPGETIVYTETWMCYGRTNVGLHHCPNPKKREPAQQSSTTTSPPPASPDSTKSQIKPVQP